jgi:CheY-like chemotaxis protein
MMRKIEVLFVRQDATQYKGLALALERAGLRVNQAVGRQEALRVMYSIHPDVILLDCRQDPRDGNETLGRIRLYTDTPVILLASGKAELAQFGEQDRTGRLIGRRTRAARVLAKIREQLGAGPAQPPF